MSEKESQPARTASVTPAFTVSLAPKDDGWNLFVQREGYGLTVTYLDREGAQRVVDVLTQALRPAPEKFAVHFAGGPWDGQSIDTERITAPLFAVGHEVGNHYWLDTKSDPPTYHWDGTPWERVNDER